MIEQLSLDEQRKVAEEIREWEEEYELNLPPTDEEMEDMFNEFLN